MGEVADWCHTMNQATPPHDEPPPPSGSLSEAQRAELLDLVRQNKKIEAIKRHREILGTGLAEAKAAVEGLVTGDEAPPMPLTPAQEQELVALLQRREKVAAIRRYRELVPGTELMIARQRIEALAAKHGIQLPSNCFIATTVFGPDSPEVAVLRDWRDARLAPSLGGRLLIQIYGLTGPLLAALSRRWLLLRRAFRAGLTRFLDHLVGPK